VQDTIVVVAIDVVPVTVVVDRVDPMDVVLENTVAVVVTVVNADSDT